MNLHFPSTAKPFHKRHSARLTLTVLAWATALIVHAQEAPTPTASDWGNIGLLQTPTARMAEQGEIAFTASYVSPYGRYNLFMQPFSWLEGGFRYSNITNHAYGPESLSGNQRYKDKSIDFKVRLWKESHWLPEVAFGMRDVGGTGLFSSEYLVANKRFGPIDASVGLATGYIGNRGDFTNPLGAFRDSFKTRPSSSGTWGNLNTNAMFHGPVGIFGGLVYQTPWKPLQIKLEYDGNDYKHEPFNTVQKQSSPINVGLVYTITPNVIFQAALERGNTAMFAITLRGNPVTATPMPKLMDTPPEALHPHSDAASGNTTATTASNMPSRGTASQSVAQAHAQTNWQDVAKRLHDNAGLIVEEISRRGSEIFVTGQQQTYFWPAQGLGRTARILDNSAPDDVQWFTLVNKRLGMRTAEASVNREKFREYVDHRADLDQLSLGTELNAPAERDTQVLYKAPLHRFGGGFDIGYNQNLGGPNGFILYRISANYQASYFFTRNLWLTGLASGNLLNNYNKFKYDAPSNLPRVRTNLREYMTRSDINLPNLQLTTTGRLGRDVYAMAYAGYLEWMYAGAGGEVLYRPMGERWALGGNINRVRQRDFSQHFGLRKYAVNTGHVNFYYAFGRDQRTVATLSAGRYLAGDWGATLDVARTFSNGVTMGAYATKTNVSSAEFGEGSFDKGIYISIPFDLILPRSTGARASFLWQPLYRDGGAMLQRKYSLYSLTNDRDDYFFYENLDKIDK